MSDSDRVKTPMASSLQQVIGALLFVSDRALAPTEIRDVLKNTAEAAEEGEREALALFTEALPREIADAARSLAKEVSRLELGVEIVEVNGAFRMQTRADCGRWVRNLLKLDRPGHLSRPALETLAIVAYRQPISKAEIEAVRGVMVDHMLKTLMELHLVRIVGRSELPGRPFLYGTTPTFLDHFGLKNLNDLNELDPTLQRSRPAQRRAAHRREPEHGAQVGGAGGPGAAIRASDATTLGAGADQAQAPGKPDGDKAQGTE